MHGSIGTSENATALRLLYYPPLPEESTIKPEQVRCGEHSDYGSITLLFQDSVGGLEVGNTTVSNSKNSLSCKVLQNKVKMLHHLMKDRVFYSETTAVEVVSPSVTSSVAV